MRNQIRKWLNDPFSLSWFWCNCMVNNCNHSGCMGLLMSGPWLELKMLCALPEFLSLDSCWTRLGFMEQTVGLILPGGQTHKITYTHKPCLGSRHTYIPMRQELSACKQGTSRCSPQVINPICCPATNNGKPIEREINAQNIRPYQQCSTQRKNQCIELKSKLQAFEVRNECCLRTGGICWGGAHPVLCSADNIFMSHIALLLVSLDSLDSSGLR